MKSFNVMPLPSMRTLYHLNTTKLTRVNPKMIGRVYGKDSQKSFMEGKRRGGSLKSFFKKVGSKIGRIGKKIYEGVKTGVNWLQNNETGKKVKDAVKKVLTTVVPYIPAVGPAIAPFVDPAIDGTLKVVDEGTKLFDKLVEDIKNKNPGASVEDIKDIVNQVKHTYNTVKDSKIVDKVSEALKNRVDENMKDISKKLPDAVKAEGLYDVLKTARYLPLLDRRTIKAEEKQKKGGMISTVYKIRKPGKEIRMILGERGDKEYSPLKVAKVAGRIYLGGRFKLGGRAFLNESETEKTSNYGSSNETSKAIKLSEALKNMKL